MAKSRYSAFVNIIIVIVLLFTLLPRFGCATRRLSADAASSSTSTTSSGLTCFPAVFSFGDSLSDVGNLVLSSKDPFALQAARSPYGETYFPRPTGRYSDGRLVIDFIVQSLGLPLLNPILNNSADFSHGAGFSVAGATALNTTFLETNEHVPVNITADSLAVQVGWFKDFKRSRCGSDADCGDNYIGKSLFVMNEIGGNDVFYGRFAGKSVSDVLSYVPLIVDQVHRSLEELILEGGKHFVIEGGMPMGCMPLNLEIAPVPGDIKDMLGCGTSMNQVTQLQNTLLLKMITELTERYQNISIVYFDYYNAYSDVLQNAEAEGFRDTLTPCYNQSPSGEVQLCSDPRTHVNWDFVHPTEALNNAVVRRFLSGRFAIPSRNFLTLGCHI